jgi:hypothetical protein
MKEQDLFSCLADDGYTVTRPADLPTPAERQTVWQTHAEQQADEATRLAHVEARMIDRLRQGPATNVELSRIGLKYTARISEMRTRGYVIEADYVKRGIWRYTLVSEPGA